MKIIIIGAGQVGSSLAENLAIEDNDVIVVDNNAPLLQNLQSRLDIGVVCDHGSHPDTLEAAGAHDTDMIIAVSNNDEVNIVACQVAHTLFKIPMKIARLRSGTYINSPKLFRNDAIPIDVLISPEVLVANYIQHLIEYPGALQVLDFAHGKVQLVAVKPYYGGPMVGKTVRALRDYIPDIEMRVAAIFRGTRAVMPEADTVIETGDEVFFIAAKKAIPKILRALGRMDNPYKHVMVAGAGNIGICIAETLEKNYQLKLIDHNTKQTELATKRLDKTIVLQGDCSDKDLLVDENIEKFDVFCAVTNDDEANIMSSLQAKRLGARHVIALITRPNYIDLIEGSNIDIAISPQQATTSYILRHLRRGDIVNVYSLRRGAAEAIEVIAHGERKHSKVIGRTLSDIKLPPGTTIGAIVRGEEIIFTHKNIIIEEKDHVILFLSDKKYIHHVERLFQTGAAFF